MQVIEGCEIDVSNLSHAVHVSHISHATNGCDLSQASLWVYSSCTPNIGYLCCFEVGYFWLVE